MRSVLLFLAAAASADTNGRGGPWATFDNSSDPNIMYLATPAWSFALSKRNGAILALTDGGGAILSTGSRNQCLWGLAGSTYAGGCSYPQVAYAWDAAAAALTLTYESFSADTPTVTISFTAPPQQPFVDMAFQLVAPPAVGSSAIYTSLLWPSEVTFNTTGIDGVHLPVLPGVKVSGGYFARQPQTPWSYTYPGQGTFASWMSVATANGSWALYDLSGPDAILPLYYGLYPSTNGGAAYPPESWYLLQSLVVNVTGGCNVTGTGVTSDPSSGSPVYPCAAGVGGIVRRRLVVGDADPLVSMQRYAYDNGIGSAASMSRWAGVFGSAVRPSGEGSPYPTLQDKLGAGLLAQTLQAPLMKADAHAVGLVYSAYTGNVTSTLPVPSLLHYMSFEPRGFDSNYPDYIPIDPQFGASCDLATTIFQANQRGHLTMVYGNPTWWDPLSPTLINQTDLRPWSVLNATLQPRYETYDPVPHTGIAVCVKSPLAIARTTELVRQFSFNATGEAPGGSYACNTTDVRLPMSYVFFDQLGARFPPVDYSPFNGGMGAMGYSAALQQHMANYSSVVLHTEQGVDRLARNAGGFHGAVLGFQLSGQTDAFWGDANWTPEPLFGAMLRDVVAHYQHNLDGTSMAMDVPRLCWSLSLGIHLSMDMRSPPFNTSWAATVGAFQRIVASRFTLYPASSFASNATAQVAVFAAANSSASGSGSASYTTFLNPSNASTATVSLAYPAEGLTLPAVVVPTGCSVTSSSADVIGGFFSAYNGQPLALGGVHAVVEDRTCAWAAPAGGTSVCVWHPWGTDTQISVVVPVALRAATRVAAADANGNILNVNVPFNASSDGAVVTFIWARSVGQTTAVAYIVTAS